jgi:hypothetical protein
MPMGIMAAAGLSLWKVGERRFLGETLLGLAVLLSLAGAARPPVLEALKTLGYAVGKGVGGALTWGLLTPLYFLVFFPARILLFLLRKDPLQREFPWPGTTGWIERSPSASDSPTRQF